MKIYLYPQYVNIPNSVARTSPQFYALLKEIGVELETRQWYGRATSIPEGEPSIVRASSQQLDSWETIGKRCAALGHLCFYEDNWVGPDGFDFKGWIRWCLEQRASCSIEEHRAWITQHQDATILLEKSREFFRNLGYNC